MRKLAGVLLSSALIAAALAAPAIARPAPVTIWVQLAYDIPTDGPNLPPKVVIRSFRVDSAEAANSLCASPASLGKLAAYVRARDVSLQNTLDGESGRCVTDESGKIKMVVDNSPAGGK